MKQFIILKGNLVWSTNYKFEDTSKNEKLFKSNFEAYNEIKEFDLHNCDIMQCISADMYASNKIKKFIIDFKNQIKLS